MNVCCQLTKPVLLLRGQVRTGNNGDDEDVLFAKYHHQNVTRVQKKNVH